MLKRSPQSAPLLITAARGAIAKWIKSGGGFGSREKALRKNAPFLNENI